MGYAMEFARDLDVQRADRFVGMYVNELTLDYGDAGREAVRRFLSDAYEKRIIPNKVEFDFV
jgi:1,4-dihydroxy-6-naphthoate synthase